MRQSYKMILLALISATLSSVVTYFMLHEPNQRGYDQVDQPFVDMALSKYSGGHRISDSQVKSEIFPVVVHINNLVCVGMNLKPGIAGGNYTACYDKASKKEVYYIANGD